MPYCGVHYLWFAFVCFLIRSHTPDRRLLTPVALLKGPDLRVPEGEGIQVARRLLLLFRKQINPLMFECFYPCRVGFIALHVKYASAVHHDCMRRLVCFGACTRVFARFLHTEKLRGMLLMTNDVWNCTRLVENGRCSDVQNQFLLSTCTW